MTPSLCLSPSSPATTESPLCSCVQGAAVPHRPGYGEAKTCGGTLLQEERQKKLVFPPKRALGVSLGGVPWVH